MCVHVWVAIIENNVNETHQMVGSFVGPLCRSDHNFVVILLRVCL